MANPFVSGLLGGLGQGALQGLLGGLQGGGQGQQQRPQLQGMQQGPPPQMMPQQPPTKLTGQLGGQQGAIARPGMRQVPPPQQQQDLGLQRPQQESQGFKLPAGLQENKIFQTFMSRLPKQISSIPIESVDLGSSKPASGNGEIDGIMKAIGTVESNNRYDIKGVQTKYGRPLGRFQILESNLPSWSKQAVGRKVGKSEFLKSPELQDKIARFQMEKYHKKYGSARDVAAMWYSGKPYNNSKNIVDPYLNQSVAQYVNKIEKYL